MSNGLKFNVGQPGVATPININTPVINTGYVPTLNYEGMPNVDDAINQFNAEMGHAPAINTMGNPAPAPTITYTQGMVTPPSKDSRTDQQRLLDHNANIKIYYECIKYVNEIKEQYPSLAEHPSFPVWTYKYKNKAPAKLRDIRPETVEGNFRDIKIAIKGFIEAMKPEMKKEEIVVNARVDAEAKKIMEEEAEPDVNEAVNAANAANAKNPGFGVKGDIPAGGVYGVDERGNVMHPEDPVMRKARLCTDIERRLLKAGIAYDNLFYDEDMHEGTMELFDSLEGDIDEGWADCIRAYPESDIVKQLDDPFLRLGVAHLSLVVHEYINYADGVKRGATRYSEPRPARDRRSRRRERSESMARKRNPRYFNQRAEALRDRSQADIEVGDGASEEVGS